MGSCGMYLYKSFVESRHDLNALLVFVQGFAPSTTLCGQTVVQDSLRVLGRFILWPDTLASLMDAL